MYACINLTSGFSHFLSCHYLNCVLYYVILCTYLSISLSMSFVLVSAACLLPMRALGLPHALSYVFLVYCRAVT